MSHADADLRALNSSPMLAQLRGEGLSNELIRAWTRRIEERRLPAPHQVTPTGEPTQLLLGHLVKLAAQDGQQNAHAPSPEHLPGRAATDLELNLLGALERWLSLQPQNFPDETASHLAGICLRLLHHRCLPLQLELLHIGSQDSRAGALLRQVAGFSYMHSAPCGADPETMQILRACAAPGAAVQAEDQGARALQSLSGAEEIRQAYSDFWRAQLRPLVTAAPAAGPLHVDPLGLPLALLRLTGPAANTDITPEPGNVGGNGWHYAMGGGPDWFEHLKAPQLNDAATVPRCEWTALILGTDPQWRAHGPLPSPHVHPDDLLFPHTLTAHISETHAGFLLQAARETRHLAQELQRTRPAAPRGDTPEEHAQLQRAVHLSRALQRAHAWHALATERARALTEQHVLAPLIATLPPELRGGP